jgi:hypothetical protein
MLTLGSGERFSKYALAERLIEDLRQAEHLDNLGKRIEKYARQLGEEADKIIGRDKESLNKRNDLRRRALALLDHISVNDAFFDPEKPGTSKLKRQWVDEGIITAANFEPLLDLIKQYEGAKRLTKAEGGKANHKTSASKTAEIDPENHDEQQAIAEQGEVSGLEESQNAEKGQQGSTQEPPRFYGTRGTAREEGKKYDPFNIGAPVADHTSGDYKTTQSTELGAALDAHFGQGRLSERRPVRMGEWAEEMSSTYGGTPRSHLNRALEELLVHDKERLKNEKLDERSKSFLKSRADEAAKLRTGSGKLVEDAGELFFAMKMNSPYRYHRVAPHDASNLAYTRDQLEKSFGVTQMTPEAWARDRATFGSFAKQVYLDSLLKVRDADGEVMNLDFARAVTKELQQHQSGDIAGVGDKRMDQGKAEAIMTAAYNMLSVIITADGIAGKMVDGKFVPNKDPLRVKGGRTFESEDATMRESAEPRMYHLHRNNKTGKLEIGNSAEREGWELRGSTSATSWIQAKYNFGFELNPLQDQMLHLGLGKDQVHLDSNLVVYREETPVHTVQPGEPVREVNPATPRFYTVGQLRGIIGRKDGKTVKESPTNKSPGQISDADIETMVTRVEQQRRVSTKMRNADNERGIARQGIEKDGELFNLNLNRVLVRMLERNGINVFDALHKEHFPVETAGMLMREAFKELQAKGYTGEIFNLGSEAFDDLALYKKEYADGEKHAVQWRTVKNIVANEQRNTPRTLEDALAYETISRMVAADKAEVDVVERRANGALKDADTSPIAIEDRLNKTEKAYQAYDDGVYAPFRDPDAPDNELKFSEALQKIGSLVDYRGNNKDVPLQDKSDAVGGFRENEPLKNMTESYDEEVAIQQRVAAKTPEQRAADKAARVEAQAYDYVKSMFDKTLRAVKGHPELESFVKETFNMPFLDKAGEGLNPEFKAWLDAKAEKIAEGNKADFENILRELHGPDWAQKASKMDAAYDRQKSVPHNPDLVNSFGVTAKSTLPNKVSVEKTRGSGARVPGESALPFEVIARRGEIAQGRPGVNDLRVKVTSLDMSQPQGSGRTAESRLGPAPVEEAPAEAVKPFNAKEIAADLAAQKPKAAVTNDLINSLSDAQLRDVLLNLGSRTDVAGSAADQVIRVMARSERAETLTRLGLEYDEISEKFERSLSSDAPFSKEGGVGANLGAMERAPIHEAVLNGRVKELLGNMFSAKVVDVIMDGDKPTRYAGKFVNKVVEIWQHAPNMAGTLHHEIWHAVENLLKDMGPHGEKILADIHKHMDTPLMRKRLMEAYADEGVNSQLGDMSERAAFVFQKLSEGVKFPMIKETTSLFGHLADFVKWVASKVGFKTTTAEERSNNFMDYVMRGDFARDMDNAASVRKGLGEKNGDNIVHQAGQILKPGLEALSAVFQHTSTRIADLKIPEYDTVMELLAGKSGKGGYMNDKRRMEYIFDNEIGNAIKGMSEEEMQKFRDTAEFKAFQGKVEQYMLDAGVNPTQVLAFYDRLATLNADMVGEEMEAFITDLVQHGGFKGKAGEARTLANQIADRGFYYDKDRDLFPNRPDIKDKWSERDFTQSMARYIQQAVHQAERMRERDGNDGKKYRMNDLGALLEAGHAKAGSAGQKLMEDTLAAYNGTLASDKLSPGLRKFMGSLLFINNVRILPKAVFSQMLEPLQLAARRGTMSGTLDTLWRGIREMPRSFDWADSHYTPDKWEQLANQIGTAPSRIIANVMAQMQNGMTLPGKIGHWNDQFFKLNFMDQWNRSMHIEATKHGVEFLKEHAAIVRTSKNKGQVEHSQRLLNDLGVKVSDIKVDGDGGLFIDYENVGSDRVARAISQFVNEGMAHPDAGSNPMWMNDPRWALLAQMKRFTFAHAKYVLDPGIREYKLGNAFPVIPAVIAMPWMMAADGLRDTITMADTSYKNNWGFMDYAEHAWARSGNAGRGQFFGDVEQSVRHGGSGLEGVAGPTAELFGRIARGAHTGQWFDSMVNQVPGAQIVMPD